MLDAYRTMPDVLGESERESEAIRKFGAWRDRVKTRVLLVGALVGLAAFAGGYYLVQELQFEYNRGIAFVKLSGIGGIAAWMGVFFASAGIARLVLARRAPAKLAELAQAYELPVAKLTEIAELVRKL